MTEREAVCQALLRMERDHGYSNLVLSSVLESCPKELNTGFITMLFYGTLEHLRTIDYYLNLFSKVKTAKMEPSVRQILRMAVQQICWMDRVPDSAACNEAVKLCKKHAFRLSGYVNGVLRTMLRERERLVLPPVTDAASLAVICNVSDSLARLFVEQYGLSRSEKLLSAFSERHRTALCVNTLKETPAAVLARLGERPVAAGLYPELLLLEESGRVTELPGYQEGLFYFQDTAAYLCARLSGAAPGDRVLDLCAAPGGKSFTCGVLMNNQGLIEARDENAARLKLVQEGAQRLGLTLIQTHPGDATHWEPALEKRFDLVLCDVPCSGLGVLGKKPEIRYKDRGDFTELPALQLSILQTGSRYVRPGGVLVYSTCTLNRAENEAVVKAFLQGEDFVPCDLQADLPESLQDAQEAPGMLTLYPDLHHMDGFFICKLKRKEEDS